MHHSHIRNVFQIACATQQASPQLLCTVGWLLCLRGKLVQLVKGRSQECLTCISSIYSASAKAALVQEGRHTAHGFEPLQQISGPCTSSASSPLPPHLVVVWRLVEHHAL